MRNNLFIVAKSGWKYISYSVIAAFVLNILGFELLALIALLSAFVCLYFFRNPERELPFFQPNALVAPSDGVVVSVESLENDEYATKVEIESSYFDVAVLRIPMSAKVESLKKVNGTRVSKESKLFETLNEFCELTFVDENNNKVKIVHRLMQSFAPLDIDIAKGQSIMQSARYGFMMNGTTSLYLPSNFRLNLSVGNEVKASETLVGYYL